MIKSRVMLPGEKLPAFAKLALVAARKAHREAVKENARWGLPMIYSVNGRIVKVPAGSKKTRARKTSHARRG